MSGIDPYNSEANMQANIFRLLACTFLFVGSASAADLPLMPTKAIAAPAFSWSGFYIGTAVGMRSNQSEMDAGQGTAQASGAVVPGPPGTFTTNGLPGVNLSSTALKGDGFAGYNYQIASWVAGIEGSLGYANPKLVGHIAALQLTPPATIAGLKTTWDGAIRARLGYLITPTVLIFAAAGPAWQHIEASLTCGAAEGCVDRFGTNISPVAASASFNKLGWTAGGGLEVAIASNWFARAEYKYADFGSVSLPVSASLSVQSIPGDPTSIITIRESGHHDVSLQAHSATFGIAYKFGN